MQLPAGIRSIAAVCVPVSGHRCARIGKAPDNTEIAVHMGTERDEVGPCLCTCGRQAPASRSHQQSLVLGSRGVFDAPAACQSGVQMSVCGMLAALVPRYIQGRDFPTLNVQIRM